MSTSYEDFAKMIDHALLHPTTTVEQFEKGVDVALAYDVASVCIMPWYLQRCTERLAGSTVKPSTVIGFPHGGQRASVKRAEAMVALEDGAEELDMVVNISAVLSGQWRIVRDDVAAIVSMTHDRGKKVKVIFENCYLNDEQKIRLCDISAEAGADWVKTSTGFGTSGAVLEDLRLMRRHCPESVQVKAAGGVRDYATMLEVRAIGVSRIGTSGTAKLLDEVRAALGRSPIGGKNPAMPATDY